MQSKILQNPRAIGIIGLLIGLSTPTILRFISSLLRHRKKKPQGQPLYVGIELGGTNYAVGVGVPHFDEQGKIASFTMKNKKSGKTNPDPDVTVNQICQFLRGETYQFIGICSFGPLCLDSKSDRFGFITSTPKLSYHNFPILQKIKARTRAHSYGFDTDVNGPAYAQFKLGNHNVRDNLVYVTVGTGVGVGVIANRKTVHGLVHPEGGHIIVKRHPEEDPFFKGVCPYHGDCLQGLITNNSVAARLHKDIESLHTLDDSEKVWTFIGYYLAQLCLNLTLTLSPQIIIIGGGIMNRKVIFQHIYKSFTLLLNDYVDHPKLKLDEVHNYIRQPKLNNVGLIGAMMLRPVSDALD